MQADFLQDHDWLSELTQDTRGFLNLRHDIMERICRSLSQQDLLQLCQVSPTWSPAANTVLWEAPLFNDPESLRLFVASAFQRKSLALQVKYLSLCLRDEECPTVFRPVLDSTLFRHTRENSLWSSNLIIQLARQCENIQTLKIYGWRLKPMHIGQIGATLTHLSSFTVIGANESLQQSFVLGNTLAKLHELRLDGRFALSLPFVSTLASRASSLRSLHIPIAGMEREALTALCSGTLLNLAHLTLTYASPMTDGNVQEVLSRFVRLKTFALHGSEKVTANIIATALSKCPHLESLELRADPKSFKTHTGTDWSTTTATSTTSMRRLLIENMTVPDSVVYDLSQLCHSLTTLGLSNCRDISDNAMESLLYANAHLRSLHVIRCPGINDRTLDALGKSDARRTVQHIHFESSGDVSPQAIHQLCCAATEYTLQHVRLVDYTNIAQSDIGAYAIERDVQGASTKPVVTLDERAIDAIATASRYDFAPMPKNRYLTGEQLLRLAKELNVAAEELEDAIERVQVDTEMDDEEEAKTQSEPEQASTSPEFDDSEAEHFQKPLPRMSLLKTPHRPTTPAIWAAHGNDTEIQKYLPPASAADNASAPRYSRLSQHASTALVPESEPAPVDDFEESLRTSRSDSPASVEEEAPPAPRYMEDEPGPSAQEDWPALSGTSPASKKRASEVELGGWGVHNTSLWPNKVHPPSKQETARKQPERPWEPYTAERHEHQWQQTTLEGPTRARGQRPTFAKQNDGWGKAKTHIPWDDVTHQGYAHDMLEKQKQTPFWDNASQQWKVPNKKEPLAAPQHSKSATAAWPSIAETQSPAKRPHVKQSHKRVAEPLSDDEEKINWDVDDGITIKTSPSLGPQYRGPSKGMPKNENARSTKAAAGKQRSDEGGSAPWRDFAALTAAEQVTRTLATTNAYADTQNDCLIDTTDIANGKTEDFEARPATRSSFGSSLWNDVGSLTMDSSPPQHQIKDQPNTLVDTSDVMMSPTAEIATPTMQQLLVPQTNTMSPKPSAREMSKGPEFDHAIQSGEVTRESQTLVAGDSTLEMDLLGSSTPQSAATSLSSSESPSTPPAQPGPGKRVGSFAFEVPDKKLPPLDCYENIEVEESVRQFCEENNIPDFYDKIVKSIKTAYDDRRTKMILNSQRKKKTRKRVNNT